MPKNLRPKQQHPNRLRLNPYLPKQFRNQHPNPLQQNPPPLPRQPTP
jgi:hypothetical protein